MAQVSEAQRLVGLTKVFKKVFPKHRLGITRETSADQVEGWDSLTHVAFILEVEKEFGVSLRASEIADLASIGDLLDLLERKSKAA